MKRLVLFLIGMIVADGASAPAPFPPPTRKPDLELLRGEWVVLSSREWVRDSLVKNRTDVRAVVTVCGDRCCWHEKGQTHSYVIRVDATRNPKAVDLRRVESQRVWTGIYKLEGNVLTIRIGFDERPESFSRNGWGDEEHVLRRKR